MRLSGFLNNLVAHYLVAMYLIVVDMLILSDKIIAAMFILPPMQPHH